MVFISRIPDLTQEISHSTYEDARSRYCRLLPILPPSATEIHRIRNIDNSELVGGFRFDSADRELLIDSLTPITGELALPMWRIFPQPPWWPVELTESSATILENFEIHRCKIDEMEGTLALDREEDIAWFWNDVSIEP
ncbi:hypothetical protein JXA47_08085 [Candidatus Sumerlaeota bacterium]|nr:hypothetical protein [Candidatus Sumerlaeota bacterium]